MNSVSHAAAAFCNSCFSSFSSVGSLLASMSRFSVILRSSVMSTLVHERGTDNGSVTETSSLAVETGGTSATLKIMHCVKIFADGLTH